jgi:hypothetical protein
VLDTIIPSPVYWLSLATCIMLPVWLVVISWLAPSHLPPMNRLWIAIIAAPLFSLTAGILLFPEIWGNRPMNCIEIFCAGLLYLTAIMIAFSAWSLVGYGFTVSILMEACLTGRSLTTAQLLASFAGGRGLTGFVFDRAGVLLRMGLMLREGDRFRIAGSKALQFARVVKFAMDIYSIHRRESN